VKALVFLATYNEVENIDRLIIRIVQICPHCDILVVDDNSPDGTAGRVKKLQSKFGDKVHLIVRPKKMGLASAYIAGFEYSMEYGYDKLITMDADHSHDPEALPLFLKNSNGNDLILGSRYVAGGNIENWSFIRHLISWGGNAFAQIFGGLPFRDCTSGFRCYNVSFVKKINLSKLNSEGYGFLIEVLYKFYSHGAKIIEVPITFTDRVHGKSKISKKIIFEAFFLVVTLFLKRMFAVSLRKASVGPTSKNPYQK